MANGDGTFFLKPVGMLAAIITTVVAAAIANQAALYEIRSDMKDALYALDKRLISAEHQLSELSPKDRWKRQDMYVWSRDLKDRNSGLKLDVPDPRTTMDKREQ